jgi:hypothetical protein
VVRPHECSVSRAEQKFRLDERAQKRITHGAVQTPQPLRLRDGQAKTRHLDVLALHTSKRVEGLLLSGHCCTRWAVGENRSPALLQQRVCHHDSGGRRTAERANP